jgi:hypothetical protein
MQILMKTALACSAGWAMLAPMTGFAYPGETVAEAARDKANPAALYIIVPQAEIEAGIDAAGGGGAQQGGLVGALIAGAMDASRAKKALSKEDQLRLALDGFDVDAIARAETVRAFAGVDWVASSQAVFAKDPTLWGKMAILDAGTAPRLLMINYTYQMSPDFSTITVGTSITIAEKVDPKAKKPEKRLAPERLSYAEGVHVMASLPSDPAKPIDGFATWTANDSRLLKDTLQKSFAKAASLAVRAIQQSPDDIVAMSAKDRQKLSFGWHRGRVVEGVESIEAPETSNGLVRRSATVKAGGDGVLIWAGYFVHSRVLPSSPSGGAK